MKKIQKIILAFMLGIVPIQSALADNKATELVIAAGNGNLEKVKSLLNKGVDINAKETKLGLTALMFASSAGYLNMVKYLISKGADINVKSSKAGETALMRASIDGHLEVVKYLIDKGADINAKANSGRSPLMIASSVGYLNIVKYLISKGANVNAVATIEEGVLYATALDFATVQGYHKIVEVLKNAGAKSANEIKK